MPNELTVLCMSICYFLQNCQVYLCGTKKDLLERKQRGIDHYDATDYADVIGAKLFETSSKTGANVGK